MFLSCLCRCRSLHDESFPPSRVITSVTVVTSSADAALAAMIGVALITAIALNRDIRARAFAQFRINRNISAKNRLNTRADIPDNRPGSHDNTTNDSKRFCDPIIRQLKRRRG
jgi:hypothetical protein